MVRSFSNRIWGGVCGGLADSLPLNAWLWRVIFIVLTLATLGAGAGAYLLLWWMLPLRSPLDERGSGLRGILGLILATLLIVGWFGRAALAEAFGADIYGAAALLLLGMVYLLVQIGNANRGNIGLGLVAVAIPILFLLGAVEGLPVGLFDALLRSWPALLIFFGLSVILRGRMRFGGVIALIVAVVIAGGVAGAAFSSRQDSTRTENTVSIREAISDDVNLLQVNLTARDTTVRVAAATDDARTIEASFTGSENSVIVDSYDEAQGGVATFTITEDRRSDFPMLEEIGRGELQLTLPQNVALAIAYEGEDGGAVAVEFDLARLNLERLNLTQDSGDVLITLPAYQPLSPSARETPGRWTVFNGDLRVVVPDEVGVRFVLAYGSNQQPRVGDDFNDLAYALEVGSNEWTLISRRYDALDVQLSAIVSIPSGRLRIEG